MVIGEIESCSCNGASEAENGKCQVEREERERGERKR